MKIRRWLLGVAGGLLVLASVAHFFGWAQFDGSLDAVDGDVAAALRIGWVWGSAAFATFGALVLWAAAGWHPGGRDPRPAAAPVAAALVLFGLWALFYRHFNPHFLAFVQEPLCGGINAFDVLRV